IRADALRRRARPRLGDGRRGRTAVHYAGEGRAVPIGEAARLPEAGGPLTWSERRRRSGREFGHERREDSPHLGGGRLAIAGVVDDVVGELGLLGEGHLAGDLSPPLRLVGAV